MMKKSWSIILALLAFTASAAETIDCSKAYTTIEINQCAATELGVAQKEMQRYFDTSLKHNDVDAELVAAIKAAQSDWEKYYNSHCDSVYTQWREGTIRGVMALSCQTKLTRQRTHELWENFLTYMDSTPPVLPEPKFSSWPL